MATGAIYWVENAKKSEGLVERRNIKHSILDTLNLKNLEKEMATHSSVLAWTIPGMGEPGGLPSMGSHRVGHNWSDFAAAAAAVVGNIEFATETFVLWITHAFLLVRKTCYIKLNFLEKILI